MKYNGWTNYDTWNVALWIQNDEGIYNIAKKCKDYYQFADLMESIGEKQTPDKVNYGNCLKGYGDLNIDELDVLIINL